MPRCGPCYGPLCLIPARVYQYLNERETGQAASADVAQTTEMGSQPTSEISASAGYQSAEMLGAMGLQSAAPGAVNPAAAQSSAFAQANQVAVQFKEDPSADGGADAGHGGAEATPESEAPAHPLADCATLTQVMQKFIGVDPVARTRGNPIPERSSPIRRSALRSARFLGSSPPWLAGARRR